MSITHAGAIELSCFFFVSFRGFISLAPHALTDGGERHDTHFTVTHKLATTTSSVCVRVCVLLCLRAFPCAVSAFWPTCLRGSPACRLPPAACLRRPHINFNICLRFFSYFFCVCIFIYFISAFFFAVLPSYRHKQTRCPALGFGMRLQSSSRCWPGFYLLYTILLLFQFFFLPKYAKCVSQTQ